MLEGQTFEHAVTIYHEDVDLYGMVYHSNYLKYMERARSEMMLARGIDFDSGWQQGVGFVVSSADLHFKRPARLHNQLQIISTITSVTRVTLHFQQVIHNEAGEVLCTGNIKIACINAQLKPMRIPKEMLSGN